MKTKVLVVIYFILPTNFFLLLPPFFQKTKTLFFNSQCLLTLCSRQLTSYSFIMSKFLEDSAAVFLILEPSVYFV